MCREILNEKIVDIRKRINDALIAHTRAGRSANFAPWSLLRDLLNVGLFSALDSKDAEKKALEGEVAGLKRHIQQRSSGSDPLTVLLSEERDALLVENAKLKERLKVLEIHELDRKEWQDTAQKNCERNAVLEAENKALKEEVELCPKLTDGDVKRLSQVFEECEFSGSESDCNFCDHPTKRTWWLRTSHEYIEGDYYCDLCALKHIEDWDAQGFWFEMTHYKDESKSLALQLVAVREALRRLSKSGSMSAIEMECVAEEALSTPAPTLVAQMERKLHLEACMLDKPDDRLYHAADRTWWKKEDGHLKSADAPTEIAQKMEAAGKMAEALEPFANWNYPDEIIYGHQLIDLILNAKKKIALWNTTNEKESTCPAGK